MPSPCSPPPPPLLQPALLDSGTLRRLCRARDFLAAHIREPVPLGAAARAACLEVRTDATMENGFRWLTVGPKSQPGFEIVLMKIAPGPRLDEAAAASLRELVRQGAQGGGVFDTADCRAAYEELKAKGVEFTAPPKDQFYGIEATFRDAAGNWFSLTQPKPH
jgi:hypothetical protein